ncbi:MAG: oxygen-independent coproporphyrinogen III oxidase [Candidatus Zixiibacteriota bacterium]
MNNKSSKTVVPIELLKKYDRPGPRYTSYPTVPNWTEAIDNNAYRNALENSSNDKNIARALYCHVPFCRKRCYYCGCNTVVSNKPGNAVSYVDMVIREIENTAKHLGGKTKASQLHFGGGTPTYLSEQELGRLLDTIDRHFEFINNSEKSIELDPRVTSREQLKYLANRGFNRASIGVQDFNEIVQAASGRIQSYESVENILNICRELKFKGINFDLIYGLPNQNVEKFSETIEKAIAMKPDRLAVYSFAYLPQLKTNQSLIDQQLLPSTEEKYKLFARAVEMFTEAGYWQIGMDHFALPNDELAVALDDGRLHRNFMGYTVQTSPEMIGFGMSSIGYVDNTFVQNISKIDSYKNSINNDKLAIQRGIKLNRDDLIRQSVILSLMCNFNLDFADIKKKYDIDYFDYFAIEHKNLKSFFEDELLHQTDTGLEITNIGKTFIRNIAMTYDAYLSVDSRGKKATFSRTI